MKQSILLKSLIEILIVILGYVLAYILLLPITSAIEYNAAIQITIVMIILVLSVYWIFFFDRSIILKSIWVRSILFIVIVMGILTLSSQFLEFIAMIDSFDLNLFGNKYTQIDVSKEAYLIQYIYRTHLLLYAATIMSLLVFEIKLLKSILNFITRMR